MPISPARKYTNTLFWQVCDEQSQGSPESSNSLTSKFYEQEERPPFRACACAHMRMCRRYHFRFPEFSLKFADISGYLRPNTLVMYAVFPQHRIANQVVQRCKLPLVVLVNALYGLGQLLISLVAL